MTETTDQSLLAGGLGRSMPHTGRWHWIRVLFSAIWLVYLGQPLSHLSGQHSAAWLAGAVAVTAAFCAAFIMVVSSWDVHQRLGQWGLVLIFPLAVAFTLMFTGPNASGNVAWIYVASAAGWVIGNWRTVPRVLAVILACYAISSWLGHDGMSSTLVTLIPIVCVCLAMSGMRTQMRLMWELRKAREEVAYLAANEERMRLARDMHDLTGQSLSMITLKSELAARLLRRLPESSDRDRVRDEIEGVAAVSRQTLRDIREAISGYRRPTLAVEIITARAALASAGIAARDDTELTLLSGTFDLDAEAALAWCLREAVTNVVRHSAANTCWISLTRKAATMSLAVRDDGRGHSRPEGCGTDQVPAGPGPHSSGLRGISERLSAVGGTLELRPDMRPGFCLLATVPTTMFEPASALPDSTRTASDFVDS